MPHSSFPLDKDGMIVQAMFGLNGPDTAALVQAGQPVPRPVQVRALIDSGADATTVAPHVPQRLGLTPFISGTSQTASGSVPIDLYRMSLTISDPITGPILVYSDLVVAELTTALPVDALIGLNVLRDCLLILDGPGKQFILSA